MEFLWTSFLNLVDTVLSDSAAGVLLVAVLVLIVATLSGLTGRLVARLEMLRFRRQET